MRYPISKAIAAGALALVLLCGASAAAVPVVRHIVSGWWNSPDGLAALPENPRIHYESGAAEQARAVAAALPAALARVEAVQRRPFAHPVTIGVYVSPEAFVAANGAGRIDVVGTTFLSNVMLSPALFSAQRQRMPAILTHELSHAHLQGWISELAFMRLPRWFTEGLAVMVSGGGGAEGVSEAQAREAIRRGEHIAPEEAGSLFNLGGIKFEQPADAPANSFRIQMAYRQSGMFVAYLREANPAGFDRMMDAILDRAPFAEALADGYGTDAATQWRHFVAARVK